MIRRIWEFSKNLTASLLRYTGLLSIITKRRLTDGIPILMYHRVINDELAPLVNSSPGIVVSEKTFETHMKALRRHFNPISLEVFQAYLEHDTVPPRRSCVVTFDDGWLDNYEVAFPILKKYEIPATIFLPTDYISSSSTFWQEEILMRLTRLLKSEEASDHMLLSEVLDDFSSTNAIDIETVRDYVIHLKGFPLDHIDRVLRKLRENLPPESATHHYDRHISWEQAMEMSTAGISFGSHTLSHRLLCSLDDEQCRNELVNSRHELESRLGPPVRVIAYPNGDHDERVIRETAAAGYTTAFTTIHGLSRKNVNPYAIPRVNIHENNSNSETRFMCTCVGLF